MMPSTLETQLLPFSLAKYKNVPDTLGWHLDPNVKAQPKFCLGAKRSGPLTKASGAEGENAQVTNKYSEEGTQGSQ